MSTFTLPTDIVDNLVEIYRGAVPQDVASQNRRLDEARSMAKIMASAETVVVDWARSIVISTAQGVALDALGDGEGLHRQGGETDDAYRPRLRTPPDAQTATAILASLQQVIDANGGGDVFLVELPRDGAYSSRGSGRGLSTLSRGRRMSGGVVRMVIALIPASADCLAACTDILRTKKSAAKDYLVQEYVSG